MAAVALAACLRWSPTAEPAAILLGGYCLFWFAFARLPAVAGFGKLPDVSYGTYLYGWPVQKLLLWYLPWLTPWALFPASLALSCLCGLTSWYLVEKPFLSLKRLKTS